MTMHATKEQPGEPELLAKARENVEAGDRASKPRLREAAEALALTWKLHKTPQRKMAQAVGKSQSWVALLLAWQRDGYTVDSPFGPTTKVERDYHANQKKAEKAAETAKVIQFPKRPERDAARKPSANDRVAVVGAFNAVVQKVFDGARDDDSQPEISKQVFVEYARSTVHHNLTPDFMAAIPADAETIAAAKAAADAWKQVYRDLQRRAPEGQSAEEPESSVLPGPNKEDRRALPMACYQHRPIQGE